MALLKNLLRGLLQSERIITTIEKAKETKPLAEKIITWGKKDSVHARRMVFRYLSSRTLVKRVFEDVAPRFIDRSGGYTRILKLGNRKGDSADMSLIELVK